MARKHPLLRGIGWLGVIILAVFAASFFTAYLTGGESKVLSMYSGEGVGVLQVDGAIEDSRSVLDELKRFADAPWIKAVVVRIDSPGGAVAPTQEIFEAIRKVKKKKPFIASMGGVAASGGYYIAAACDKILANPGTLTGSIGVIMQLSNVEDLMKKIGVKGVNIKSGPNKDIGSPLHPLSDEGRAILQGLVDDVHSQFVNAVAKGRSIDETVVRKLADGRIYSGAQAKAVGLVDEFGTLDDAIEMAARRAGIEAKPAVYYSRTEPERWWEKFFMGAMGWRFARSEKAWLRYEWSPVFLQ